MSHALVVHMPKPDIYICNIYIIYIIYIYIIYIIYIHIYIYIYILSGKKRMLRYISQLYFMGLNLN